jgi:hypothetical protein
MSAYSSINILIMDSLETKENRWLVTLVDTGDGSGDCYVELPPDLLIQTGWQEGDILSFEIIEEGALVRKKNS